MHSEDTGQNEDSQSQPKMSLKLGDSGLWWLWLTVLTFVLDQVTKYVITNQVELGEQIVVLPLFNITHVHNYGAAFSILSEAGGWQRWALSAVAFGVSSMLLWWLRALPRSNKLLGPAYALILGGAFGNVFDRLYYGYVEDFIHFYYELSSFPAFNIADAAITVGAMLLIYEALTVKPAMPKSPFE